jgi:hypothetical protein
MKRKYLPMIPKKPLFRRSSYMTPDNYSSAYEKAGITNNDEQTMLFHVTQFGGFRCKGIPSYIKNKKEFLSNWFEIERDSGFYHFGANNKFLSTFGNIKLKPLKKIWHNGVVNEEEMGECGFSDEEVKDSQDFLHSLNEFYSSLKVGIAIPASGISLEDRVNLARFHEIPFLVKKPKAGGRFFHPGSSYQRIASSLRPMITINGKKTSEIDLSAATLQFLGIILKEYACSLNNILSEKDPYQYFMRKLNPAPDKSKVSDLEIQREDLKTLIYTTIYSQKKTQKSNVSYKLRCMGIGYSYYDLVELFPEFFEAINTLKSKLEFPPHIAIFKEESRYAQEVLKKGCLELKLPIIPIHDSFITTRDNIPKLKKILDSTSKNLYGKCLYYKVKY